MAKAKSFNYLSEKNDILNNDVIGHNTNVWRYYRSITINKTIRMKI